MKGKEWRRVRRLTYDARRALYHATCPVHSTDVRQREFKRYQRICYKLQAELAFRLQYPNTKYDNNIGRKARN